MVIGRGRLNQGHIHRDDPLIEEAWNLRHEDWSVIGRSLVDRFSDLIAEKEMKEAEQNVKKVKEAAVQAGIKTNGLIMGGKPSEAIMQTAKDKQADLIVLGSHGKTGVEKLLMGSVAERVIVLSSCPVMVVKSA